MYPFTTEIGTLNNPGSGSFCKNLPRLASRYLARL
jgi:hypothetical protein